MNGLFNEFATPGVFLSLGLLWRPKGMVETPTTHDTIGTDAGRHRIQAGGQYGGNPDPLTLFGNRSTATGPGASRRRQDDRLHATL